MIELTGCIPAEQWLINLDFDNYEQALSEVKAVQKDAFVAGLRQAQELAKGYADLILDEKKAE